MRSLPAECIGRRSRRESDREPDGDRESDRLRCLERGGGDMLAETEGDAFRLAGLGELEIESSEELRLLLRDLLRGLRARPLPRYVSARRTGEAALRLGGVRDLVVERRRLRNLLPESDRGSEGLRLVDGLPRVRSSCHRLPGTYDS